jgi:hypothetical protein
VSKERKANDAAAKKEEERNAAMHKMEELARLGGIEEMETGGTIVACPGAGKTCTYDDTHRVCAQLLDGNGKPLKWGEGSFWDIANINELPSGGSIRTNNGDSTCISLWTIANMIKKVGCKNVHIRCDATDVDHVMEKYWEGDLAQSTIEEAEYCFEQECATGFSAVRRSDDTLPGSAPVVGKTIAVSVLGAVAAFAAALQAMLQRRPPPLAVEPMLG